MTNSASEERVLRFTVVDVDRNRRHHTIGYVLFPLTQQTLTSLDAVTVQRDLEREVVEVSDVTPANNLEYVELIMKYV